MICRIDCDIEVLMKNLIDQSQVWIRGGQHHGKYTDLRGKTETKDKEMA